MQLKLNAHLMAQISKRVAKGQTSLYNSDDYHYVISTNAYRSSQKIRDKLPDLEPIMIRSQAL